MVGYGWIELVGLLAGALGLSVALPQLFKVLKAKNHVGVSITSWLLQLLNYSSWLAFSIRFHSPSQLAANILAAVFTSILVFVLLKEIWNKTVPAVILILTLIAVAVTAILLLPEQVMEIVLLTFILARIPQILTSYKSWRIGRKTNVSQLTYLLMGLSSIGWITYGAVAGLHMNVYSSTMQLTASALIVMFEIAAARKYRKQSDEGTI